MNVKEGVWKVFTWHKVSAQAGGQHISEGGDNWWPPPQIEVLIPL